MPIFSKIFSVFSICPQENFFGGGEVTLHLCRFYNDKVTPNKSTGFQWWSNSSLLFCGTYVPFLLGYIKGLQEEERGLHKIPQMIEEEAPSKLYSEAKLAWA